MKKISCLVHFLLFTCIGNISFATNAINLVSKRDIDTTSGKAPQVQLNNAATSSSQRVKYSKQDDTGVVQTSNDGGLGGKINVDNKVRKDDKGQKYHIVQYGENIYRIALKYGIKQQDLLDVNGLKDSNIREGQKLLLPEGASIDENVDNKNSNNVQNDKLVNENLNKIATTNDLQQQTLVNKIDSTTFLWPSRGTVVEKFGTTTKTGGRSEGVKIGCELGSIVRAAASGSVIYSDGIPDYGNVILIQHYNGFITAYGYTDPLISVGDRVKKGQVIAHVKKEKQSKRSVLYFSIRKNRKSYDPEKIVLTKNSN